MISSHPTHQQIKAFVEGNCSPGLGLIVSAHIDMCRQCRVCMERYQEEAGKRFLDSDNDQLACDFGSMLADITRLPASERSEQIIVPPTLELDGREFKVPRALQRYLLKTGSWSHLPGKLWQAPVDLGDVGKANFIFMGKGGSVPEHTHKGSELTLVIDGEFSDGLAMYDSGDFIEMNQSHTHTPQAESDEGCLVFSIVDQPLHFTSGLARLLNPFSHLFF